MEYLFPNGHEHSGQKSNQMAIEAKQQEMHQKDSPKALRIPKEKKMLKKQVDMIEDEKSSAAGEKDIIAMPLSLEDVALYHPVIEPQQIGKYWTNYAGKIPSTMKNIN